MSDNLTVQQQNNVVPGFTSKNAFQALWNIGKMLSESAFTPDKCKGKIGDCAIMAEMAIRLKCSPVMVMQEMNVIYGIPSWSSKFLISVFNECGRYSSVRYKYIGEKGTDSYGCIAYATELSTGEVLEGPPITIGIAKAEGWYQKKGSKWQTIPDLMLRYRSASWFIKTVAPELSLGFEPAEEIIDSREKDITPVEKPTVEIAQNMGTKVLDMPKPETKTKVEQEISKSPAQTPKKETVKKEKPVQEKPVQKAVQSDLQEELSETPDF